MTEIGRHNDRDITDEELAIVKPFTPVFMRMVDKLFSDEMLPMGEALELARVEEGVAEIPQQVEDAMLRAAYRIVIHGLPSKIEA
jgi:hypothetical protein